MAKAKPSGRKLSASDASLVLGMIARGDRKHDIAAWFGVNQGRIAEVQSGDLHKGAKPAAAKDLPPAGPYSSGQSTHAAAEALKASKKALEKAIEDVDHALDQLAKGSKLDHGDED